MSDDLMHAYRWTSFFADTPQGRLCLRIGEPNPALDALLSAAGVRSWAYVTAYNPRSVPLGEHENTQRQQMLEQAVQEAGFLFFFGTGIGDDGQWPPGAESAHPRHHPRPGGRFGPAVRAAGDRLRRGRWESGPARH